MTLAEQISTCEVCRQYAHMIDPANPDDLFQEGWIDVWEYEQRSPDKASNVRNYKRYFYSVLKNRFWRKLKKQKKHLNVDWVDENEIIEQQGDDIPPVAYLIEWMNEKTDNEDMLFYKNILTLAFVCKNARDAANMCEISKTQFYEHLKQAKQQLRHDYNTSTNPDNIHCDPMV